MWLGLGAARARGVHGSTVATQFFTIPKITIRSAILKQYKKKKKQANTIDSTKTI
jgi:hypothetical protein